MTLEDRLRASLETRHGGDPEGVEALLGAALARRRAWSRGTLKTCSSCGEAKPSSAFHLDSTRPDGREPRCRACRS